MTTTKFDICSQSLSLLRADTVSSFDDGTNEADICATHYDDFVQDILTRYQWSFCTIKRRLNRDEQTPVNEYSYAYVVPAACLKIWNVFDSSNVGALPIDGYDIQTLDTGRRILTNSESVYIEYTFYLDEGSWPAYFKHFAVHAFAALIAMPVTDQPDIADRWHQKAWGLPSENEQGGKFAVAKLIDAQQKPPEVIYNSPLAQARFS